MAKKILIVDDEPDILELLESRLLVAGYRVVTASGGEECLAKVKTEKPRLIILDVLMPDINGFEVCKRLKKDDQTKRIPVIMLTAKSMVEDIEKGLTIARANDYEVKPYDWDRLLEKIKKLI